MNDLTFNILKIVISITVAIVSSYIIPLLREKVTDSKNKRLLEKWSRLQ